jgi:hypothetical protein
VIVGVLVMVGESEAVGLFVGDPVKVMVGLSVGVGVSVEVGGIVRVNDVDGVNVPVFSAGRKGVSVAEPGASATLDGPEAAVIVGMKGRNGASAGGSTHPAR